MGADTVLVRSKVGEAYQCGPTPLNADGPQGRLQPFRPQPTLAPVIDRPSSPTRCAAGAPSEKPSLKRKRSVGASLPAANRFLPACR
jgi:hypothetical protein